MPGLAARHYVRVVRLLITNDDGIDAVGLHELAAGLVPLGHDIVVAAPDVDQSGSGAGLGRLHADTHIDAAAVDLPAAPDVPAFAVAGTPALCVIAATLGAFGPAPDIVVSGINAGTNLGRSVLHSGTVGAALTAQGFGLKGLAVSLATGDAWPWRSASAMARQVLDLLVEAPNRTALNLNVPALDLADIKGIRWAHLDPFGSVRTALTGHDGDRLQLELVATDAHPAADTDRGLVRSGFASLTALVGVAEAWPDPGVLVGEITPRSVVGAPVEKVHGPMTSRLTMRRAQEPPPEPPHEPAHEPAHEPTHDPR